MEKKSSVTKHLPRWVGTIKVLFFSLIPLVFLLFTLEIVLRFSDFRYSDSPLVLVSRPEQISRINVSKDLQDTGIARFVKNRHMFWVLKPSFDEKYSLPKRPNVFRVITLGCSCTQVCQGTDFTYPDYMQVLLNAKSSDHYEVLNAGVGGYSSYQGLQLLKHTLVKYKPDMVTIFFGWNDHWIAQTPDHRFKMKADWEVDLINFLEQFRTYQACHWLIARWKEKALGSIQDKDRQSTERVPPEEYEKNLKAIVDFCRAHEIQPVLITAPFMASQWSGPWWYFPNPMEDLVAVHMAYNEIVRKVSQENQVPIIDLERALIHLDQKNPGEYFSDGIHFAPTGCRLVAELIVSAMENQFLLAHKGESP